LFLTQASRVFSQLADRADEALNFNAAAVDRQAEAGWCFSGVKTMLRVTPDDLPRKASTLKEGIDRRAIGADRHAFSGRHLVSAR
jgi:hypothetical protein